MKKIFFVILVLCVLLVMSCATAGGNVNDDTFRRIYDRWSSGLVYDGATTYTVKNGDTLTSISGSLYGDRFFYPVISLASRDVVLDPDKIQAGMVLTIPNLEVNLNNLRAKEAIKGAMRDCANTEASRGRNDTAQGLRDKANSL